MDKYDLMNNYVFQNKYKMYFEEDLSDFVDLVPDGVKDSRHEFSSKPFHILYHFPHKDRIITFPNIFSYAFSVNAISNLKINDLGKFNSKSNNMQVDCDKRRFRSGSYTRSLNKHLSFLMSKYDYMYKIDIRSFYNNIYTHVFEHLNYSNINSLDKYITVYNNLKTNGLVLGNLLSTVAANEVMEFCPKKLEVN